MSGGSLISTSVHTGIAEPPASNGRNCQCIAAAANTSPATGELTSRGCAPVTAPVLSMHTFSQACEPSMPSSARSAASRARAASSSVRDAEPGVRASSADGVTDGSASARSWRPA